MKKLVVIALTLSIIFSLSIFIHFYPESSQYDSNDLVDSINTNNDSDYDYEPIKPLKKTDGIDPNSDLNSDEDKIGYEQEIVLHSNLSSSHSDNKIEFYEILGESNRLTSAQQGRLLAWRNEIREFSSNYHGKIFFNGLTDKKQVALTFDDGPDASITSKIIDILNEYQVKGNFFFTGAQVSRFPQVVKKADLDGHLVLNHTQNHLQLDKQTFQLIGKEILQTEKAIFNIIGKSPKLVRPPYGSTNSMVMDEAEKNNNLIIIWSIDTMDWSQREANNIAANVLDNIRPGDIVLMHSTSAQKATAEALPLIIEGLKQKSYDIVGLDELLNVSAYK